MKCFDWTNCCAVGVFAVDAQFNNYIGHLGSELLSIMANSYSVTVGMSTEILSGNRMETEASVAAMVLGDQFLSDSSHVENVKAKSGRVVRAAEA